MHAKGTGVPKDLIHAHAWLTIAETKGSENARNELAILENEMTPEQKSKARELARALYDLSPPK